MSIFTWYKANKPNYKGEISVTIIDFEPIHEPPRSGVGRLTSSPITETGNRELTRIDICVHEANRARIFVCRAARCELELNEMAGDEEVQSVPESPGKTKISRSGIKPTQPKIYAHLNCPLNPFLTNNFPLLMTGSHGLSTHHDQNAPRSGEAASGSGNAGGMTWLTPPPSDGSEYWIWGLPVEAAIRSISCCACARCRFVQ